MWLYSERKELLSRGSALVAAGIVIAAMHSFYTGRYLADGVPVPIEQNILAMVILGYQAWSHWRLGFDLVSDILKIELVLIVLGFGATIVSIMLTGIPSDPYTVVAVRIPTAITMGLGFAALCGCFTVAFRSVTDRGKDIPSPDDF